MEAIRCYRGKATAEPDDLAIAARLWSISQRPRRDRLLSSM
jgi:hypothetical protein